MSTRPTLVLEDDDERTVVDSSMPAARAAAEPGRDRSGHPMIAWWRRSSGQWRSWLLVASVAGLCLSVLGIALEQRRVSIRLQRTIDGMREARRALHPPEKSVSLGSGEVPGRGLTEGRAPGAGAGAEAATREELELEAANFVVSNDFRAAIESYVTLATQFRDQPAFSDVAVILRAKLACEWPERKEGFGCD